MLTGMPSARRLYKGIEGEDWQEMYEPYKEVSWAGRVKKPQEAQKAKALWKMKAAKDAREHYYDPMREEGMKGRNETILALWEFLRWRQRSAWKINIEGLVQVLGKRSFAWDSVLLRTASTQCNVPGRYGPYGELFFFLLKQEPRVFSELVRFGPSIKAEKVKACALIGLLMMAEENSWRSDSGPTRSCEDTRSQSRCDQRMTQTKESSNMECFDGETKV